MEKYFVMVNDVEQLIGEYKIIGVYDSYCGNDNCEGYAVYEMETPSLNSFYKISEGKKYKAVSFSEDKHIESWEKIS